jgi:sialate O-acetylesterase
VTLPGDGQPVTRVRYAWSDAPAINLVDDAGLPVGPFETPLS